MKPTVTKKILNIKRKPVSGKTGYDLIAYCFLKDDFLTKRKVKGSLEFGCAVHVYEKNEFSYINELIYAIQKAINEHKK